MSYRKRHWAVAGALVALLAAGPAVAQSVFHRGNDSDPETLDPQKTQTTAEAHLLREDRKSVV